MAKEIKKLLTFVMQKMIEVREKYLNKARPDYLLLLVLFLLTLSRLYFIEKVNISPDEAYYWDWSRNLQLSYYDHPPLVAYLIYFFTAIGTSSVFWVRSGAVLLGTGMAYIVYLMARDIFKSQKAGILAVLILNSTLIFSLGSVIITPDTPQGFFWILTVYFFYKAINTDSAYYMAGAGIFLGLTQLSKYTGILLVLSFIIHFILSKKDRVWLKRKSTYIALLLAFLLFLPVIIWNFKNDWLSFSFQISHGFKGVSKGFFINTLELIGSQILLMNPFLFIGMAISSYCLWREGIKKKNSNLILLFATSLPIFLFFVLVSLNSKIEGNWPAAAYLTGSIGMAGIFYSKEQGYFKSYKIPKLYNYSVKYGVLFGIAIVLTVHYLAVNPMSILLNNTSLVRRLYGWSDLGQRVSDIMKNKEENGNTFIFGNRHQVISEIAFYTDKKYQTYQKGGKKRYTYLKNIKKLIGKNAIYVTEDGRDESDFIKRHFNRIEQLSPLHIVMKSKVVRTFLIYYCYEYKGGLINT